MSKTIMEMKIENPRPPNINTPKIVLGRNGRRAINNKILGAITAKNATAAQCWIKGRCEISLPM